MATEWLPLRQQTTASHIADRLDRLSAPGWRRRLTALVALGLFFSFFEVALGSIIVPLLPTAWADTTFHKAAVIGAIFAGEILGTLFLTPLADRLGRRTMFQVNLALYAVFAVASAFASSLATFVALRVLVGIGLGAELILVDSYLAELLPSGRRGKSISQCYALSMLAVPLVGLLAAFLPHHIAGMASWRWLVVSSALGAVLVWLLRRGLPESPRWLAAAGRHQEAMAALGRIERDAHAKGPMDPPERSSPVAEPASPPSPTDRVRLLRPPQLARTVLACVIWICQTVGFYGFSSIAPLVLVHKGYGVVASLGYAGLSALGFPLGGLLTALLAERVQRKLLLAGSTVLVGLLGVVFAAAQAQWLIVVAGFLLSTVSVLMATASHAYTSELFPTAVRATANGRTYALSRVVSAVLPFGTLTLLYDVGAGPLYALCAAILVAMAAAVAVWGPRTNSRSLEQI